jgi:hypothetical protein
VSWPKSDQALPGGVRSLCYKNVLNAATPSHAFCRPTLLRLAYHRPPVSVSPLYQTTFSSSPRSRPALSAAFFLPLIRLPRRADLPPGLAACTSGRADRWLPGYRSVGPGRGRSSVLDDPTRHRPTDDESAARPMRKMPYGRAPFREQGGAA